MRQAQVAALHGASVDCPCCYQHEDGNVAWISNKRPALLRRHVVNDNLDTDRDVPAFTMEQYPNFNFVGSEAVLEFGMNSGGSNEAQSLTRIVRNHLCCLMMMMMMMAMIAFQMPKSIISMMLKHHHSGSTLFKSLIRNGQFLS